jgi:hypothetical protein
MPTRRYALARGMPKDLEVSWQGRFTNLTVKFQGSPLPRDEQAAGYYRLPDGSDVSIKFEDRGIVAIRNGEFLPGTAFDPVLKVRAAVITLAALAALHLAVLVLPVTKGFPFPQNVPLATPTFCLGIAYAALAWGAWRRSQPAMALGLGLTFLEALLFGIGWAFEGYIKRPLVGLGPVLLLYEGLEGLKQLAAEGPDPAAPSRPR